MNSAAPAFPMAATAVAPLRARAEALGVGIFRRCGLGKTRVVARRFLRAELTRELGRGVV